MIVTGDLGLLHDLGSLAALREAQAPVRIVVVNNDGGGIFGFLPQADELDRHEFEALLGTPRGSTPPGPRRCSASPTAGSRRSTISAKRSGRAPA